MSSEQKGEKAFPLERLQVLAQFGSLPQSAAADPAFLKDWAKEYLEQHRGSEPALEELWKLYCEYDIL